jgi:hypothetical protein
VLDKYKNRGLTVLAINVEPAQNALVLPVMKALGVTFVPLESDWKWAEQHYGVQATPEARLLDEQGRIMFKPAVHDAATQAVFERQVEALLDRQSSR